MIHYHCADINPASKRLELAGRHLLVSFAYPGPVRMAHEIGQSVCLDNGAFSVWRSGKSVDWAKFYDWADEWLNCPTTWAIIPDVIEGDAATQDALIEQWPHGGRGAPVWHMHEPIDRLCRLTDEWARVCLGSSGQYAVVGSMPWRERMDAAFNAVAKRHQRMPWLHGLRMQGVGTEYPFGSVDSADVARNNNRPQNTIRKMLDHWDKQQPRIGWSGRPAQEALLFARAFV